MSKLYKPIIKPPSGRGYEGADPWDLTPRNSPYEPSFVTQPAFPGQRFWTWGIFALLEGVGEDILTELHDEGWEPMNEATKDNFLLLENQFAQTLIVVEKSWQQRYWARTEDIRHAQQYPVFLTHQTGDEDTTYQIPPDMVIGATALVLDGPSFHRYTSEQLGEVGQTPCAQVQAGMLLFPPGAEPSAQETRLREQERLALWEQTHEAARQLAERYWSFHQSEIKRLSPIREVPSIPHVMQQKQALIPASFVMQGVLGAYHNAHSGAKKWSKNPLPTYVHQVKEEVTSVVLRPHDAEAVGDAMAESLWRQVRDFSDLDVDVLLSMLAQAITASGDEQGFVWISSSQILDYRDIKPKTRRDSDGSVQVVGHRREDIVAIAASMNRIRDTHVMVRQWTQDETSKGKRGRPRKKLLQQESYIVTISDVIREQDLEIGIENSTEQGEKKSSVPIAWRYRPGSCMEPLLQNPHRKVAWLLQHALSYDPYHDLWEKRLARYFTFQLRLINSGGTMITRKIGGMLEELSLPLNESYPDKTRSRFEKAMDRLQVDGHIAEWGPPSRYSEAVSKLPSKKWLKTWLGHEIDIIAAPLPLEQEGRNGE